MSTTAPWRSPRRALPVVLMALVALAGCTVGPSQRPPVAVRGDGVTAAPAPAPPPDPGPPALPEPDPQRPVMNFYDCTDEAMLMLGSPVPADRALHVDCGELTVPADPGERSRGRARVGVLRVGLADAPEDRPPLLMLGDSAAEPSALHAVNLATQVPRTVLDRFTLVGLDRRGTGVNALDCAPADARAALVDADTGSGAASDVDRDTALAGLLEQARAVVQECHVLQAGGVTGYRTASTAADVAQLRSALGVDRLSAVGVGDGASALASWANRAPESVGRLVLDGPPDQTLDEPARTEARAKSAEDAFGAFAVACTAGPGCPLGPDPRAAVSGLLDQLRKDPQLAEDGRTLTAGEVITALLSGLGEPRSWPALTTMLASARAGDPVKLLDFLDPLVGLGGRFDATLATYCNDATRRLSPGEISDLATRWRTDYPLFGTTLAVRLIACSPWPSSINAAGEPAEPGLPPVLVLGTAHDPRSVLEASRRIAEQLGSAGFLSWQGTGTGAYPRTPCVTEAVDHLLLDGQPPATNTDQNRLCPP